MATLTLPLLAHTQVCASEQLKQVRRVAKALNLTHRIEEATGQA